MVLGRILDVATLGWIGMGSIALAFGGVMAERWAEVRLRPRRPSRWVTLRR